MKGKVVCRVGQACNIDGVLKNRVMERTTVVELRAWKIASWDERGKVLLERRSIIRGVRYCGRGEVFWGAGFVGTWKEESVVKKLVDHGRGSVVLEGS